MGAVAVVLALHVGSTPGRDLPAGNPEPSSAETATADSDGRSLLRDAHRLGLGPDDVAFVRDLVASLPETLPPTATTIAARLEGDAAVARPDGDGMFRSRLLVVNPGPTPLRATLLCMVDAQPARCGDDGASAVEVAAGSLDARPLEIGVTSGARLDIVVAVAGDHERPHPASLHLTKPIAGGPSQVDANPWSGQAKVYGGCGFVTFSETTAPQATFTPPGRHPRTAPLWVIVEQCEGQRAPFVLRAVLDGTRVIELPGLGDRWLQVFEPTLAVPLDLDSIEADRLQVIALRATSDLLDAGWISHAVELHDE